LSLYRDEALLNGTNRPEPKIQNQVLMADSIQRTFNGAAAQFKWQEAMTSKHFI
jgi:hypothetical protein